MKLSDKLIFGIALKILEVSLLKNSTEFFTRLLVKVWPRFNESLNFFCFARFG